MTNESPFVSMEEVASTPGPTFGLTKRQIRWDVKHGYLPGDIDRRGKVVIRRDGPVSWNAYTRGEWMPAEPGSHMKAQAEAPAKKPVGIHSIRGDVA